MFTALSAAHRQRSASRSTDDHSTREKPHRVLQRYARDLSMSSHSLASSNHDDLPIPSVLSQPSHPPSAQSTPMTSPSTGYSSLFPGSLSSTTSESVPCMESKCRSEFGVLTHGSHSPMLGSASSHSNPVSPWSQSPAESDTQPSASRIPHEYPSGNLSHRPSTAPHSPSGLAAVGSADTPQTDRHTRSHSRLTVSIKNLLSRPAIPSPSRFSINSATTAPSESEASSSSFYVPPTSGKWSMTPPNPRPPDPEISGSVAHALPSPTRASNALIDAHRRYASEAAAKIYGTRTGSGLPASQESLSVSVPNASLPLTRGREPRTRNVLRRRPSGSARLSRGRHRGMSSLSRPDESDPGHLHLPPREGISRQDAPFPLTPASAVVEAYKQQEQHRDHAPSPSNLSIDDHMSSSAIHDGGHDRDQLQQSPAPYYTVFGSSSGRRVQAGGPDDRWSRFDADQRGWMTPQVTLSHQPSMSDPVGRSLTRKVSTRWRKFKGGAVTVEESPSRGRGHSKGRPSLQELWGGNKSSVRLTGQSMDGVPNAADGAWANPTAVHARSGSEKGSESDGGKLWRLMRRISTGGLRDRFQSEKFVPPVPSIPKELLEKANRGERHNEPPPKSCHQLSSCSDNKGRTWPSTAPKNIAVTRPSPAASSPNSSDVASMQFYHKTHSARSSVSSYGEPLDALRKPDIVIDRHIITPLEQLRLGDDHQRDEAGKTPVPVPRSPRRSTSVPAVLGTAEETGSGDPVVLPSPRRQTCSGDPPSRGCSRPSSASASTSGSPHASYQSHGLVLGRTWIVDGIVSLSPPPRPARNSKRGDGSLASSPSHSMVVKPGDGSGAAGGVRQMDRTASSRSDMTARLESPEPGPSLGRDQDVSSRAGKQFTFRELDAPRRPPLSEREKADIWDDLLARSDEAGGTLHINGATELMSDSMRFSTLSEI